MMFMLVLLGTALIGTQLYVAGMPTWAVVVGSAVTFVVLSGAVIYGYVKGGRES